MKNCDFKSTSKHCRAWFDLLELICIKGKTVTLSDGLNEMVCTARTYNLIKKFEAPVYTVKRQNESGKTEMWIATINIFG